MLSSVNELRTLEVQLRALKRSSEHLLVKNGIPADAEDVVLIAKGLGTGEAAFPKEGVERSSDACDKLVDELQQRLVTRLPRIHVFSYAGLHYPQYFDVDTLQVAQARRQSQHLADLLLALKSAQRITLVGHSMGGLIIAHFLTNNDINEYVPPEIIDKIRCVILIGAPIEPYSLIEQVGKAGPTLQDMLHGYTATARRLYEKFPRTIQIIGQEDIIANVRRSGYDSTITLVNYGIRPICIPAAGHLDLPSEDLVVSLVTDMITVSMTNSFEAIVQKYFNERPFAWECSPNGLPATVTDSAIKIKQQVHELG